MNAFYPTMGEPATADYVLSVLRDLHRIEHQGEYGTDPETTLSFDMTIDGWMDAFDYDFPPSWWELGRTQNAFWGINCSDADWRAVLKPTQKKRLREVCDLIAVHATRPRIRPARFFGSNCTPAGAFLTIRSLLHEAGACVDSIAPSTPLAPYVSRYSQVIGSIARLAPGALPPVRVRAPRTWLVGVALLSLLVGVCIGLPVFTIAGVVLVITFFILERFHASWTLPATVELGELRTFRDLAIAVASENGGKTTSC